MGLLARPLSRDLGGGSDEGRFSSVLRARPEGVGVTR